MKEKDQIREEIRQKINEKTDIPEESITVYTNGPFQKVSGDGTWIAQALLTQDVWENKDIRDAFRFHSDQQMTVDVMGQTYEITSWSDTKTMAEGVQRRWLEMEEQIKREAVMEDGKILWHWKQRPGSYR